MPNTPFMAHEDMEELTWGSHEQECLSDEAFKKYTNQIADLISVSGIRTDRLSQRGYVIAINGGWGVGKTSFTWKLINAIKEKVQEDCRILVHYESLLPFGNTSESLSVYLQRFADKVWYEFGIDIRKSIQQFIIEATPRYEYKATISIGPLQLSRNISAHRHSSMRLIEPMKAFKNNTAILFIDDIDRLRQEEITIVLRMVEKLRSIPNIIVLLPMHRKVVRGALEASLSLGSDSRHFLNKTVDYEIYLQNSLDDLKSAFLKSCNINMSRKGFNRYRYSTKDIIWYMTLFHLLMGEAARRWDSGMRVDEALPHSLVQQSTFLRKLDGAVNRNNHGILPNVGRLHSYPIFKRQLHGRDKVIASSRAFGLGSEPMDLRKDHLVKFRALEIADAKIVKGMNITSDNEELEALKGSKKVPVFFEFFLELLQKSEHEEIVTDSYKLREVALIARRVSTHAHINQEKANSWQSVYEAINTVCDEFIA